MSDLTGNFETGQLPKIALGGVTATSKYTIGPIRRWWRRRRMLPQNSVMK